MTLSSLEKQQEKLNNLNEKIKNEKKKIDNKVGHEIIKLSNLDYSKLTTDKIKELTKEFSEFLKGKNGSDETEKSNDSVSDENINSVHEKTENNF
ncbi:MULTISPECIES: hypothetical protein [Bacillota]|jgi:predicted S18 family serine protease|uniref:hypothetical protein n=1 Tax=Bacillota TaxID=1239 RepID=UPI0024332A1C|nr:MULTISPECIES: hypothetical protein [Bacillota]MCH4199854.1 hypothetical protein [Clostridium tyrobutyricum]MDG6165203.1 hypothetical protein [Lactococcus formosensis]MDG6169350.1 hypothetical protein [Lactococcus formosensis]